MDPNLSAQIPTITLCPHCHLAINPRECYNVEFCMPARYPPLVPPPPSTAPANHAGDRGQGGKGKQAPAPPQPSTTTPADHAGDRGRGGKGKQAPAPPLTQLKSVRLSPLEPPSNTHPPSPGQPYDAASLPPSSPTRVVSPASSTASTEYEFDNSSFDGDFLAALSQAEVEYFPPVPPPPSTSSPSTESSLVPSVSDEPAPLPVRRRWVVFRGRAPGVYTSSAAAIEQTEGFPDGFKLAFDDPAQADNAFNKFREDGAIPVHGRGPWVVFVGRKLGVFTTYNGLCESVRGFPKNVYRCCDSVEEGQRALDRYLSKQRSGTSTVPNISDQPGPNPTTSGSVEHPSPDTPADISWWCCFAGAKPGVYMGLDSLRNAYPALGGVRQVTSEEDGWEIWTSLLLAGQVKIVPRPIETGRHSSHK